ncbi:MAG: RNA polymerase sigma factor [Pseudomonadota bacterium]
MQRLWNRLVHGPDSFEAVVGPHVDHLYRLAWRLTGSATDAEDLVQDLLIKVYPRRDEIRALDAPRPWLARALYRLHVDRWRRAGRSPLVEAVPGEDGEDVIDASADTGPGPEALAGREQDRERLAAAVDQLNADQRALVLLHDVEGYTLNELETVLEAPVGTLKSRLHRARANLRQHLAVEPLAGDGRVTPQR